MQRRLRKIELPNFSVVKAQQLNRLVLPSVSEYKNLYQEYLDQKLFTAPQVYISLLESLEEQIRENLTQLRMSKKENKENSNFLMIKNKKNQDQKILFWNQLYDIDYKFNGLCLKLNYEQYQKLDSVVKKSKELLQLIKKLQKKSVNCHIALKNMDDNMSIRVQEFKKFVKQKQNELQLKEKKYEKRIKQFCNQQIKVLQLQCNYSNMQYSFQW